MQKWGYLETADNFTIRSLNRSKLTYSDAWSIFCQDAKVYDTTPKMSQTVLDRSLYPKTYSSLKTPEWKFRTHQYSLIINYESLVISYRTDLLVCSFQEGTHGYLTFLPPILLVKSEWCGRIKLPISLSLAWNGSGFRFVWTGSWHWLVLLWFSCRDGLPPERMAIIWWTIWGGHKLVTQTSGLIYLYSKHHSLVVRINKIPLHPMLWAEGLKQTLQWVKPSGPPLTCVCAFSLLSWD